MIWYKNNDNDIIISTRVRLARNLDGIPFPNALKDTKEVTKKIKDAILESNSTLSKDFSFISLDGAPNKRAMAEEHLISFDMLNGAGKSVLISEDRTMSIMLMEEDHIRLQVILNGYEPDRAWAIADKVDDVIEESLSYAFDEEIGYLTACPTNAGTGLRLSVMMHLPALSETGRMQSIISSASGMGIAVRGLYGEGSKAYGNLYQISNQITEGASETDIISRVKNVAGQIEELEKQARASLLQNNSETLSDRVYRAYGALKYARTISSSEAKSLLSDVLTGQKMGIIKEKGTLTPIECMVMTEPAMLSAGKELNARQRDICRAEFLRENI